MDAIFAPFFVGLKDRRETFFAVQPGLSTHEPVQPLLKSPTVLQPRRKPAPPLPSAQRPPDTWDSIHPGEFEPPWCILLSFPYRPLPNSLPGKDPSATAPGHTH